MLLGAEIQRPHSCGQKDEQQQVEKLSQFRQLKDLVSDARGPVILTAADQPLSPATALCSAPHITVARPPTKPQIRLMDPLEKGEAKKRQKGNKKSAILSGKESTFLPPLPHLYFLS